MHGNIADLFTFESVANKENTYKISAQAGDKKVYVNHKKAPSQCVSAETETEILLESHEDGTVSLKDMTEGTGGAYLYFWKGDTSKLHFDRYSSDVAQCHMELWKAAPGAKNDLGMPGYEKVTDISQLTSGTKYLITAKADDGTYYAVNPSAASSNFNHVAKVVEENIPIKEEASVALGTNAQFDNGGEKKISKCLFTFDKQEGTENQYKITAVTEDGKKVYLGPKSSSGANRPLVETEAVITVAKNGEAFTLQQAEDASNSKYLYFWKDDASKFHFDRNGSVDSKGKCDFELYRKDDNVVDSEIPGYTKISELSEIENGGQYLIAMKATVEGNNYYLLNPATGNEKYSYVAKVTGKMYEDETIGAKTDITITGKAEGKTSVKIGNKTYFIFVKNDVEEVTIKIGETYNVPGKILNESEVTKDGIVSLEKRENMPPYKAISEITEGTYLFGNNSHIMLNTVSTAAGSEKGLGMKAVNFNNDETAKDFMWTLTKSGEGYTMKDAASGKYINISGNNVELKDAEQVLTIRARANGGFSVSANNYYLNNWAGNNNKVAAYPSDDNGWSFYKASAGNVVTGVKEGTVTVAASEGINYKITVVKDVPEVKEYTVTATVNDEAMGTAKLSPEVDKYKEGTEVTATAKVKDESKYEFVNWTVGDEEVSKKAEYKFTVDKDMELKANFKAKDPVEETFTVKVKANDDKMGTVAVDPVKENYAKGDTVIVIAEAKEGYEFVNWTSEGKVFSDSAAYEFAVEKDMELTANFKAKEEPKPPVTEDTFKLNVTVNDDKMGTVKLDPDKAEYAKGEKVTATATAKEGYEFVNWTVEGKAVSTETTYEFLVDKNVELTANFKKTEKPVEKVTITVKANDSKMGTVKLDPAKESYENGEIVTAIATAKEGYKFVNWTVAGKVVSDKAEYKFKVDRAAELQANFVKVSEDPKPENPKDEDKAVQTGDNGVSPIIPLAGLMLAAGAAVVALRKKED